MYFRSVHSVHCPSPENTAVCFSLEVVEENNKVLPSTSRRTARVSIRVAMTVADPVRWTLLLVSLFIGAEARKKAPEWMYNRMFAASEKPVLRRAIQSDKDAFQGFKTMVHYYENMASVMTREGRREDENDTLEIVNIPNFLLLKGWPEMRLVQRLFCFSERRENGGDSLYREEKRDIFRQKKTVFKALGDIGAALDSDVAERDVKQLFARMKGLVPQWKHVMHADRKNYTTPSGSHRCLVRANNAYRVNGTWGILVKVTNDRPAVFPVDRERRYLGEHLTLTTNGSIDFLPLLYDLNYKPELTRKYWGSRPVMPASSVYSEYGGNVGINNFGNVPRDGNLAVRAALSAVKDTKQSMVQETSLPSNSAILLFPVLLAVIPLALFADASSKVVVGYVVVTDFLALLPLLIKGVEILQVQNSEFFATRTMVYGDLRMPNTTSVASTWSCSCSLGKDLSGLGYSFVLVAILSMVAGSALEVIARAQVERSKRRALEARTLWAGGKEYLWERAPPCEECDCFKLNASTAWSAGGLIGEWMRHRRDLRKSWDQSALGVDLWDCR